MTTAFETLMADVALWRRDLHQHPELAFNEHRTADFVADTLHRFGWEVHRGLAKTGVVGTLRVGDSPRVIGLRADMDALPMQEKNTFDHCSVIPNTMHACGHDGHTAMLLGAAAQLAQTRNFNGTVHCIFQPAEESAGGGGVMVDEGLFEQFPVDAVYGMHNWPGMPVGQFGLRAGALEASMDNFDITIKGTGAHAAMPHLGLDPIVIASQLVTALQTLVSRNINPLDSAVVSVTQIEAGSAYNIIPDTAQLRGCLRALNTQTQAAIQARMHTLVNELCGAFGAQGELHFKPICPALINHQAETRIAAAAARAVVGEANVDDQYPPTMGSEDFAFMLEARPGSYILIGNGPGEGGCLLHSAHYDFNDAVIPLGVRYWCRLVETVLTQDGAP